MKQFIKRHHRENVILTMNNRNCLIIMNYLVNIDGVLVINCESIPNDKIN